MNLLTDMIVFTGFVIAWRLAGSPTFLSPFFRKATMDGVVLRPSSLAITTGSLPSMTATQLLVVPRSIPIIFPILYKIYQISRLIKNLPESIDNHYAMHGEMKKWQSCHGGGKGAGAAG